MKQRKRNRSLSYHFQNMKKGGLAEIFCSAMVGQSNNFIADFERIALWSLKMIWFATNQSRCLMFERA